MKTIVALLLLALFLPLFYSCEKEDDADPYEGRIKRIKHYSSIQDTIVRSIEEYKYDSKKRLEAIESESGTVKFEYNGNNQLIRKYYISGNPDFDDTITYIYNEGKLAVELQNANRANSTYFKTLKTVYEYENTLMVKKKSYRDDVLEQMRVYEYKDDLVTTESVYDDSLKLQLSYIRYNHYVENKKLAVSNSWYSASWGMEWFLSVYYFYNGHGDLDLEYAEQGGNISAGLTYCKRYEYY